MGRENRSPSQLQYRALLARMFSTIGRCPLAVLCAVKGLVRFQIMPDSDLQNIFASVQVEVGECSASATTTVGVSGLPPSDFGQLEGVVKDSRNRRLNGATVIVFLDNDATAQETTSNGGKYKFDRLIVGDHDVEASHNSFRPDRKTVRVRKDQTAHQNFKLR